MNEFKRVGITTGGNPNNYWNQLITSNIHINGRNRLKEGLVFLPTRCFDALVRGSKVVELELVKL